MKERINCPHTICEIIRESLSTIPEKTERDLYFPLTEKPEEEGDQKMCLLSGKWLDLENPYIFAGPIPVSILEYTNQSTLEFSYSYPESEAGTTFAGLFSDNESLKEITSFPVVPGINSVKLTFSGCKNLETLNFKGLDFSGVHSYEGTFQGCESLKNIIGPFTGISRVLDFSDCPLTLESILTVFDALITDFDNPRYINISEETYNLLSQEQLSIPESKGWEVIVV